jgi:hypothetical protein
LYIRVSCWIPFFIGLQKRIPILLSLGCLAIVLSSNQSGSVIAGNGNHTGSGLNPKANCSGPTCHAPNNSNTTVHLTLTDTGNTIPVTSYIPGKLYTLHIAGTNNSSMLPKYGLQLSSVRNADITGQAGNLSTGVNANISLRFLDGLQLIEHNHPITASGSGTSWNYITECYWSAPPAGTGTVKFFLTLNAVNANGFASGDQPNITSLTVEDGAAFIGEENLFKHLDTYPNPVRDQLTISSANIDNGEYHFNAYDMVGKHLFSRSVAVTNNKLHLTLEASNWNSGVYFIQAQKGNQQSVLPIVKQ